MNEVVAVFPANVPFAVTSYSVAATTAAQATETVEAVEPVTANEAGALGGLPSWLRYGLRVWFAPVGVTARSSELVVAATLIAFRHAAVANLCALSLTNARICKPDDETPLSFATCAGPARRTATIGPAEPLLRDSAIAAESEAVLAHRV